jgi:hypothetical protein
VIDPATNLEVSDTNGSHPDLVLDALCAANETKAYEFTFD